LGRIAEPGLPERLCGARRVGFDRQQIPRPLGTWAFILPGLRRPVDETPVRRVHLGAHIIERIHELRGGVAFAAEPEPPRHGSDLFGRRG
jgi:hypothetical protein